jgi:hypothetical protein
MEAKICDYSQDVPALSHFGISYKDHVNENPKVSGWLH